MQIAKGEVQSAKCGGGCGKCKVRNVEVDVGRGEAEGESEGWGIAKWNREVQNMMLGGYETANGGGAMRANSLADRLLDLAVRIGKVVDALPDTRLGRHIAGQLVRSGTSPAPNYEEACGAESPKDFVHKLRIVLKELRETRCWMRMIIKSEMLSEIKMSEILDETEQLCNIVGKSILTATRNHQLDRKRKPPTKSSDSRLPK